MFRDKRFLIGRMKRSYPDIHNLLMMCNLFNVSLDDLVKGDVKRMEHEEIKKTWILDVDDANLDVISMCFNRTALFYLSWWVLR